MSRPRFETTWGGSFILVEPGEFLMGSEDGAPSESPSVTIILQHPFFLGARPVTQATWQGVMGQNPARFQDGWHTGLNPVERVSYIDACDFISRLNETPLVFPWTQWALPSSHRGRMGIRMSGWNPDSVVLR